MEILNDTVFYLIALPLFFFSAMRDKTTNSNRIYQNYEEKLSVMFYFLVLIFGSIVVTTISQYMKYKTFLTPNVLHEWLLMIILFFIFAVYYLKASHKLLRAGRIVVAAMAMSIIGMIITNFNNYYMLLPFIFGALYFIVMDIYIATSVFRRSR